MLLRSEGANASRMVNDGKLLCDQGRQVGVAYWRAASLLVVQESLDSAKQYQTHVSGLPIIRYRSEWKK